MNGQRSGALGVCAPTVVWPLRFGILYSIIFPSGIDGCRRAS